VTEPTASSTTEPAAPASTLRCAVVGVGSMGRHHARNYAELEGAELVAVVDADAERGRAIAEQHGGAVLADVEALLELGVDAVSIATPTVNHRAAAEPLLKAGVPCLIEKPLAATAAEAEAIKAAAESSGAILQVGHIVRYDPVMRAVRKVIHERPRFIEIDRVSPMPFRSLDVSVVLDVMIHDIDLVLMLVGREPDEVHASGGSLLGYGEDVCTARLVFNATGDGTRSCTAHLTASRLALDTVRKLRVIGDDGYVSADFMKKAVTFLPGPENRSRLGELKSRLDAGEDLSGLDWRLMVAVEFPEVTQEEPLRAQLADFLGAIRGGHRTEGHGGADAPAAVMALRTAERIVDAVRAMN